MCPCALDRSGSSDINFHPYQDAEADLYTYPGLYADADRYTYAGADRYPTADRYPAADGHPYARSAYQYTQARTAHRYPHSTAAPAD